MTKKICEICGHSDKDADTASDYSGHQVLMCSICIHMKALPQRPSDTDKQNGMTYYDEKNDVYRDCVTNAVKPIKIKDGVVEQRSEAVRLFEGIFNKFGIL